MGTFPGEPGMRSSAEVDLAAARFENRNLHARIASLEREIDKLRNEKYAEVKVTGTWEKVGKETGALGITYTTKRCSNCGFEHSLLIPDDFCPKCGSWNNQHLD